MNRVRPALFEIFTEFYEINRIVDEMGRCYE